MDKINSGFASLFIVGMIFISLQLWWLSMTLRNDKNEKLLFNQNQADQIKKQLEKILHGNP